MDSPQPAQVTVLLQNWRRGDEAALAEVARVVEQELHRLAASYLRRERPGHTLQPTALVNEAFIRLMGSSPRQEWANRSHFIAIAAQLMRQILVDHARRHRAAKRGDGETVISLDGSSDGATHSGLAVTDPRPIDLLALDEALERLALVDARKARALELKYFGGLEMAEIGEVLGLSVKTVEKDVRLGILWLRSSLAGSPDA
jgi:RNA polymerase sigma factor (TIGR02999 family)